MPRTIVIRSEEDLEALRERLKDLGPPLLVMGELLVSQAEQAFEEKRLGDLRWLPRYPNQKEPPYVNVAGLLADLNAGLDPRGRRFDRDGLGIDTGTLAGSIAVQAIDPDGQLTVGSEAYHAQTFQAGGERSQPVSEDAKIGVRRVLEERPELEPRLSKLLTMDELVTRVAPRPFMGLTDENRVDFVEVLEMYLAGSAEEPTDE